MDGWLQSLLSKACGLPALRPSVQKVEITHFWVSVDLGYSEPGKEGLRVWQGFHFSDAHSHSWICNTDSDCDESERQKRSGLLLTWLGGVQPCQV